MREYARKGWPNTAFATSFPRKCFQFRFPETVRGARRNGNGECHRKSAFLPLMCRGLADDALPARCQNRTVVAPASMSPPFPFQHSGRVLGKLVLSHSTVPIGKVHRSRSPFPIVFLMKPGGGGDAEAVASRKLRAYGISVFRKRPRLLPICRTASGRMPLPKRRKRGYRAGSDTGAHNRAAGNAD